MRPSSITLAAFLGLLLVGETVLAEPQRDQIRDQLRGFDERLKTLEKIEQGTARARTSEAEVRAIAEVAKMVLQESESRFNVIKWAALAMSLTITAVITGLSLLGYRQFRQVTRPLRRAHRDIIRQVELEQKNLRDLTKSLEEQKQALQLHREEAHRNVRGLIHVATAFTSVQMFERQENQQGRDRLLGTILRDVGKVIEEIKPTDPKVLGWTYRIQAWVFKRHRNAVEALKAIERSIELDPENERSLYNGACYAALTGSREKWVRYLRAAITHNPQFCIDAKDDADFAGVRDDPDFRLLTRQG